MKRYYDTGGVVDIQTQDIPTVQTWDNIGGNYIDQVYGGDIDAGMNNVFGLGSDYYYPDPSMDSISPEEQIALYGGTADDLYQDPSWLDRGIDLLGRGASAAGNWLLGSSNNGRTSNWQDLLNAGLGGLAMYGNYQSGRDASELNEAMLGLKRDELEAARDRSGISDLDSMAAKAMGMGILANEGRLSPDQSNPWLNFMFQGRQGLWGKDDQFGQAYAANPFGASPLGAAVVRDPAYSQRQGRTNNMQGFAEGGSVPRMGMRARLNQMRAERMPKQQPMQNMMGGLPPQLQNMMGSFAPPAPAAPSPLAQVAGGMRDRLNQMYANKNPGQNFQALAHGGYLAGGSSGQADDVNANLSHGEYVIDADSVAALGDGNNEAGAARLDEMIEALRRHKRSASADEIPPVARSPFEYMMGRK